MNYTNLHEAERLPVEQLSYFGPEDFSPDELDCLFGYSETMDFDPFTSFVEERFDPSVHIPDEVNSSFTPLQEPHQPSTPDHQTYPPSFVSDAWLSNLPSATSTPQHRTPKCEDFHQISRFSLDRGQTEVYWEGDIDLDKIFAPSLSPSRPQIEPCSPNSDTPQQRRSSVRRPRRLFQFTSGFRVEPYSRPCKPLPACPS